MITQRREFNAPRGIAGARWRKMWSDWFRHHTINPNLVSIDGWVERDEPLRQVRFLTFKGATFDAKGRLLIPNPAVGEDVVYEVRTVQLEAVPSPFPEETP